MAEKGTKARALAGGTDLLIHLRAKVFELDRVVDLKKIPELTEIAISAGEGLTLGAAAPCYQIYENQAVRETYPALFDSAWMIGGIQIQGRASVGGNVANAAPSGDTIPSVIVHRGVCVIVGPNGRREVPAAEFCTGPRQTVLQDGEILVSIKFPPPMKGEGSHYLRFIPRNEMDIAVAGTGASVVLNNGTIESALIALASVAPKPVVATEAQEFLAGKEATEENIVEASELAKKVASPITDMRGTIEQRVHLVGVLTKRALRKAVERAKGA